VYYSIMIQQELDFLIDTAKAELKPGDTYVELGSFALGTIGRLAKACPHVNCQAVDVLQHNWLDYEDSPTRDYLKTCFPEQEWSSAAVMQIIKQVLSVTPNLHLTVGPSRSKVFPNAGLQFIDADHNYDQVMADFWHCWAQARPGSLVVGHDYQLEGTQLAALDIQRILGVHIQRPAGNMWAFRKA
jgi:hypothetical protein